MVNRVKRKLNVITCSAMNCEDCPEFPDSVCWAHADKDLEDVVIYDSESSGFPGPRTELGPHQSVLFNTGAILAYDLPSDLRPIQTIFRWSASDKAPDLELRASTTRLARAVSGQERARSDGGCIELGKPGARGHSER